MQKAGTRPAGAGANKSDWRNHRGNVAMIMALAVIPLTIVAGFAVDFQLVSTKKNKAQFSLDAAVIAGTRKLQTAAPHEDVKAFIKDYYRTTLETNEGLLDCDDPEIVIQDTSIEAESICSQATTLSAIMGVKEMKFNVMSASTFGIGKVDVVFVFDVSGSMIGDRMEDLKEAAVVAVDLLLPTDPLEGHENDIRIGMVSYNNSLNAGDFFQYASGVSPNQTYNYRYYGRTYRIPYTTTCVFQREGDEKFSDAAPGEDQYVTPADYWNRTECRGSEPIPLTNNRQTLVDHVDDLNPSGGTAGHLGVAWGWYMISPDWWDMGGTSAPAPGASTSVGAYTTSIPLDYDEPDSAKAIILMTDGDFNSTFTNAQGSSGWQAKQLCDNIKDKGVLIYSIAFQAPSAGREVLSYCATSSEFYFNPQNGQELTQTYSAIATSISDLRLSK